MILSDRSIREEVEKGRIVIEPFDDSAVQPSSVDLHIDRYFRVFRNHTMGLIDVKEQQEDLTELVQIDEGDVFMLHPGEFVLGSTLERVALPDDLVARLEGKSSLGRLGLLIHSSLPASEQVLVRDETGVRLRPIGEVVGKRVEGSVVGFDPVTLEARYFPITGWYEGPPDRIYEVRLQSGRRVRVTAGHNLFTLDRQGGVKKIRTGELRPGVHVAVPRRIPATASVSASYDLRDLVPEHLLTSMVVEGPTIAAALEQERVRVALSEAGFRHTGWYRSRGQLPAVIARSFPRVWNSLGPADRMRPRGGRHGLPVVLEVTPELAWLFGFYVAEGYRRRGQVVYSNTDAAILDRVEAVLRGLQQPVYRVDGQSITSPSSMLSEFMTWIGLGGKAPAKRLPLNALGWPDVLLRSLLEGMMDGDGDHSELRRCYWTCSSGLVDDLLYLAPRLGLRAGASYRDRAKSGLYQVSIPQREHKLLTTVPLPDLLLVAARKQAGLDQKTAAKLAGYSRPTDLCNIERRSGRDAVRRATLRRLAALYAAHAPESAEVQVIQRLAEGDLAWDRVESVVDTGVSEPIYDLEVRPDGQKVENFLAGTGGVFVSNTAGFVDSGWDGHLTLELSNVANLPITLYPGMKIGQISFLKMTTPADHPYGSKEAGSKYQHQRGPTPSRYFENFRSVTNGE